MTARLCEFYGGTFTHWLDEVPGRYFWAAARMLEPLKARASLTRISEMAAAFGSMDKDDHRNYVAEIQRRAVGPGWNEPKPIRPTSVSQMQSLAGDISEGKAEVVVDD